MIILSERTYLHFQFLTYFITVNLGNGASDICQFYRIIRRKHFAVHAQIANCLTET